jgi:hypothetical protein
MTKPNVRVKVLREAGIPAETAVQLDAIVSKVPADDQPMLTLLLVIGHGDGIGAERARDIAYRYIRRAIK